jgi:hypothetical protein
MALVLSNLNGWNSQQFDVATLRIGSILSPFDGQNPFIVIYHSLSLAGGPVATKRWNNLDAGRLLSRLRLPGKIRRKFFSEARCIQ